jgi:HK97 family phage prohead protease
MTVTTEADLLKLARQINQRAGLAGPTSAPAHARTVTREMQFIGPAAEPNRYTFRVSASGKKADGYDIRPESWDLRRYLKNPTVLWSHDTAGRAALPIGRTRNLWTDAVGLMAEIEFDLVDEFAAQVAGKVDRGFLRSTSVNFRIREGGHDRKTGIVAPGAATLMEISLVAIGEDEDALIARAARLARRTASKKSREQEIYAIITTWRKLPAAVQAQHPGLRDRILRLALELLAKPAR